MRHEGSIWTCPACKPVRVAFWVNVGIVAAFAVVSLVAWMAA